MLHLGADGTKVGWKKGQSEATMLDLADVSEVRLGTTVDPETVGGPKRSSGMGGTKTLRKCADGPDVARRAFSLILDKRTLDIEMDSEARCAEFQGHFEALVKQAKLRRSFAQ